VIRPGKELRGFQRIALVAGGTKTVTLTLPAAKLAFWDEKTHAFVVEPGDYDVLVGASSNDIRARARIRVAAESSALWTPSDTPNIPDGVAKGIPDNFSALTARIQVGWIAATIRARRYSWRRTIA